MKQKVFGMPKIDIIFILFIIIQSGTIIFYGMPIATILPLVLFYIFKKFGLYIHYLSKVIVILLILFIFHLFQYLVFSGILKSEILAMLNYLTIACLVLIVKKNFVSLFIDVIVYISVISLFFYICILVFPDSVNFLTDFGMSLPKYTASDSFYDIHGGDQTSVHLWLYNLSFSTSSHIRNFGIFYEPGRFAIFLVLALIFILFIKNENILSGKSIILILTLLTTLSTAGYSALILILYSYSNVISKNILVNFSLIILTVFVSFYVLSLDFMSEKISDEIASTNEYSRFFAMFYHWEYIQKSLFLGYGIYMPHLVLSPNGITIFLLKHGILLSVLALYGIYKAFNTLSFFDSKIRRMKLLSVFIFLLVCFSQTITTDPFFYALSFLGYIGKHKKCYDY
jgi:hypothetical protein